VPECDRETSILRRVCCARPLGGGRYEEVENISVYTIFNAYFTLKTSLRIQNILSVLIINPLNAQLNPICHLLALLGAHHIFRVSSLRVNIIDLNLILCRQD
jgi:hypothetical protein